ncbi:hypothetical protein BDZ97DRAFT_1903390 [Flammula alnicola]|nr:hypothetical protein BDZ97DRAFT_1903390 [Flammula alnicola]
MTSARTFPPLLGDGHGRYRVHIVGNSGRSQELSTTGAALAATLGVPFIPLDAIMWKPGWVKTSREEFSAKLRAALDEDERGWVVDGNYDKRGGLVVLEESTDVIWLDPPLAVYFPRIMLRTLLGLLRLTPPCSPGCPERLTEVFFSKKSILWWCLTNHWALRQRNETRMQLIGLGVGSDVERRRMRRFGGWGTDIKEWLKDVAEMVQSKRHKRD